MRAVRWFVVNVILTGAVIAGAVYGVATAWNIARFAIVLWAIVITAGVAHADTRKAAAARGRSVPAWLSHVADWITVAILAATGHFVFAAIHAWQAMIKGALYHKPDTEVPK